MVSRKPRRRFGAVRQLPSGRYQASYLRPDGRRQIAARTFATKGDANSWLTVEESKLIQGSWGDPHRGKVQLAEYGADWITERSGLRPRTVDLYRWLFGKYIEPRLGQLTIGEIDPPVVRRWRRSLLESGVSQTMAAKAYRLLRAMMSTAVDDDVISRNPCRIKGAGSESAPERPTLSVEQIFALADVMPDRYRALVLLAAFASLRWGEVSALRRCDLDVVDGVVHVRLGYVERSNGELILGPPKSSAGVRSVRIPSVVVEAVRTHLDQYVGRPSHALVFTALKGGPLRRSRFNAIVEWSKAVSSVGVPGLHFHDLRHSGNLLAAMTPGTTLRDLMARMGHDSMRAALIYQHRSREADRTIARALDAHIERSRSAGETSEADAEGSKRAEGRG